VKNHLLKVGAAVTAAMILGLASLGSGGVYAQDSTATPGASTGPMSMSGACTTGLAASMLSQAQMMVGSATAEATADMSATTESTPMATTEGGEATSEATADMSATTEGGTPMANMTETMCFVVYLSGAAEAPDGGGDPDGYGVAAITVDPTANTVTFDVAVAGITLPATMAHIHKGTAEESGPVVVPAGGQPDANGMQTSTSEAVDAAVIQDILANPAGYYYNVHTDDFPKGALRGQLAVAGMGGGTGGDSGTGVGTMMPTDASGAAPTATP